MFPETVRRVIPITLVVSLGTTMTAYAQQILLRYTPRVGVVQHMHIWSDVTTSITEAESGPDAEGISLETSSLASVTRRVLGARDARYEVEITLDSVRARLRPEGGTWREITDPDEQVAPLRLIVDERMRVTSAGSDRSGVQLLRGFAGGLEFVLPEQPVGAGDTWKAKVDFGIGRMLVLEEEVDLGTPLPRVGKLVARATFTLDSIMVRSTDTLAFVSMAGQIVPATMSVAAEVAQGAVTISGALAGRMIWSTSWSAYVSGGVRTRMRMQVRIGVFGQEQVPVVAVDLDVTARFQVRP